MGKSLNMKIVFALTIGVICVILAGVYIINNQLKERNANGEGKGGEKMTDVLLIVANNFQGVELDGTKATLENAGLSTEIASSTKSPRSVQGKIIDADLLFKDVNVSKHKAIVFIGGPGAEAYFNDAAALGIAKKSFEQGKITAAICIAPVILANAGILQNKNATVWDSGSGEMVSKLEARGAIFQNKAVVQDGKIITANGPDAATSFGKTIANALK